MIQTVNIKAIHDALQLSRGRCSLVSCVYTAKKHGEVAKYVLNIGASYVKALQKDLLEVWRRLGNARGIERYALQELAKSLTKSIEAHLMGEESDDFTKKGLYYPLGNGLKLLLNDTTVELGGFLMSRTVLVPGDYKETISSPLVAAKKAIRKELRCGKYITLAIDAGQIHEVRANGKVIEFL